ncbi:phage coat protein [Pseudoxanthomonas winnipegensis]|uniref:major capsid protein n=1 Tax=Pseudoxanthomonas winnipegensis TaxID=2480810 RepID=UPI0025774335|nr:major capsid protein [Pseudoxanthomonas winnipegensis]WJI17475.1 phage coat protein [Pseudoxanthomonas winnipegensis]
MRNNLFKKFRNKLPALAGAATAAVATAPAFAAVDVTEVTTEIAGAAAPIAAIGSAVLIVMVGIKVYKWVRRAM